MELIHYAGTKGSLIIEDDFENEFVYLQKPTPSLFGLAGGHNVVYLGSFFASSPPFDPYQFYGTAAISCGRIPQTVTITARLHPRRSRLLSASLSATVILVPRQGG